MDAMSCMKAMKKAATKANNLAAKCAAAHQVCCTVITTVDRYQHHHYQVSWVVHTLPVFYSLSVRSKTVLPMSSITNHMFIVAFFV